MGLVAYCPGCGRTHRQGADGLCDACRVQGGSQPGKAVADSLDGQPGSTANASKRGAVTTAIVLGGLAAVVAVGGLTISLTVGWHAWKLMDAPPLAVVFFLAALMVAVGSLAIASILTFGAVACLRNSKAKAGASENPSRRVPFATAIGLGGSAAVVSVGGLSVALAIELRALDAMAAFLPLALSYLFGALAVAVVALLVAFMLSSAAVANV